MTLSRIHQSWRLRLRWLQLLVTTGLLAWLTCQLEWDRFLPLLSTLRWEGLALGLVALLLSHLLNVTRWYSLLDSAATSFASLVRLYGIGLFCNNFLPTGIGGDAMRSGLLAKTEPVGRSIFSVALDRGMGLLALSVPLLIGLTEEMPARWRGGAVPTSLWSHRVVVGGTVAVAMSSIGLLWLKHTRRDVSAREWFVDTYSKWNLPDWTLRQWGRRLALAYGISTIAQLMFALSVWVILWTIRSPVQITNAMWVVIFISLAKLVPVAVNGLGIVEGAYVFVLSHYGMPMEVGLSAALIMRSLGMLISLLGGIGYLKRASRFLGNHEQDPAIRSGT